MRRLTLSLAALSLLAVTAVRAQEPRERTADGKERVGQASRADERQDEFRALSSVLGAKRLRHNSRASYGRLDTILPDRRQAYAPPR